MRDIGAAYPVSALESDLVALASQRPQTSASLSEFILAAIPRWAR